MNGYVELGYLVVLGSLATYSVSLATRHRRSSQTVRVVEAARLVAATGAGERVIGDAARPSAGGASVVAAPVASGAPLQASDGQAGSDLPPPPRSPSPAAGETE